MRRTATALLLTVLLALTGCSFEFSIGGLDYEELESSIAEELDTTFAELGVTIDEVDCPEQEDESEGAEFICTATFDGDREIQVASTFTSDDGDVNFRTVETLYEPGELAAGLAEEVSAQVGTEVTVECGDTLIVAAPGEMFECEASDDTGGAVLDVTATEDGVNWVIR